MGTIICATRIGEISRIVQMRAIDLAHQRGDRLVFLNVVDANALGDMDESIKSVARSELEWFKRTLLEIAQNRARRGGVEADIEMRQGDVRQEIESVINERQAELLVLGSPRPQSDQGTFTQSAIEEFAETIRRDTGVEVKIITPQS
jgi:nucleotide-binding universal stress UspA family protein